MGRVRELERAELKDMVEDEHYKQRTVLCIKPKASVCLYICSFINLSSALGMLLHLSMYHLVSYIIPLCCCTLD